MSIVAGFAPAKLNLSLRVLLRRPDGFHEIDSVVAFLDLCDSLMFSRGQPNSRALHVTGRSAGVPVDPSNLVLRAAQALADHAERDLPFDVMLDKQIPAGAGLGGGSSDAAATLRALNEMHDLDLSREQLARIGAGIGSDVPMFVLAGDGCCRIGGRGEVVEPLDWAPPGLCVLILPDIHAPTPAVYAAWDARPVRGRAEALPRGGRTAEAWLARCGNDLEPAALRLFPKLAEIQARARRICGRPVALTGTGSGLFTAFDRRDEAQAAADRITGELNVETLVVAFRTEAGNSLPEVQHADHGSSH